MSVMSIFLTGVLEAGLMREAPVTDADQDVVVIGGGIGGIAAAAFLRRAGRRVRVYEQAAQLRAVGAGWSWRPMPCG
ncbi:FAD-dependent oxidoreductase [Pseudonocardia xinjiangensis]|uniref:FAD-dependent oxidoreductase n=1 Tax=Pseudonocardia xinjiangensis TaxID=75289 RepID=UPI003D8CDF1B